MKARGCPIKWVMLVTLVISGIYLLFFCNPSQTTAHNRQFNLDKTISKKVLGVDSVDNALVKTYSSNIDEAVEPLSTPTSLASKDTSGVYDEKTGETELVGERTESFKKFDQGNNQYRVAGQIGPVHYRLDPFSETETYKEIDLTTNLTPDDPWDAAMETNGYQARFWQSRVIDGKTIRYIAQYRRAGKWLAMAPVALVWENDLGEQQLISKTQAAGAPTIDNDNYRITWANVFGPGIDFRYNLNPDEFFKTVIVNNKSDLPAPTIGTTGLRLTTIMALSWDPDAKPANGFASSITTNDLTDDTTGINSPDEELINPSIFSFKDESNRDIWWLREPKAWDSAEEQHTISVDHRLRRKGSNIFALLSVPATALNRPETTYPVFIDTAIPEEQVGASSDDGGEVSTGGVGVIGSTDRPQPTTTYWGTGARFQTVPIPQGATIDSASVSVYISSTVYDDPELNIYLEAVDDSTTFVAGATWNISGRTPTAHQHLWSGTGLYTGTFVQSPSIVGAVQDVISRGGWVSNNDLSVIFAGASATKEFRYYSWDQSGNVSGPKFNASYTSGITISGTVYTAEDKSTNIGASKTIGLSVNGAAKTTVETTAGGAFSFSAVTVVANNTITLFEDDEGAEEATLITQAIDASTNITGLEMYTNKVVLRHETAGPMTNALLDTADNSADDDIKYSGTTTITFNTGFEVWIDNVVSGKTYTPGNPSIMDDIEIRSGATFSPGANAVTINGSYLNSGTLTTSGTITFAAGAAGKTLAGTMTGSSSFYNLIFNNAAGGWTASNDITATNVLTITAGTFDASSRTITLSGTTGTPFVRTGTFTPSTSTFIYSGDYASGDTTVVGTTYNNLQLNNGSETYVPDGTLDVNGTFTITAGILSMGAYNMTVAGNWSNSGTFSSSALVTFDGGGGTTQAISGTTTFNNFTATTASARTLQFAASSVTTVTGTWTITGSAAQLITLTTSSAPTQWKINPTAASVSYVDVNYSDNDGVSFCATYSISTNDTNTDWQISGGASCGTAPVNDSLTFTNPYSSNIAVADDTTSWTFRALVTDADGPTNIDYVEMRFANSADSTQPYDSLKYRWTESTDTFSEQADTQICCTITSTAADSNAVGNQWTLDFKIKIDNDFLAKDTQYAIELYSIDDGALSDNDDYAIKYQVTTLSLSLNVDAPSQDFGDLTPGTPKTDTTVATVTTNYPNGYVLQIHDNIVGTDSALKHTDLVTYIADYLGTIAVPTSWTGTGLGICVYIATGKDAKWGTGTTETDSNNKYAGIPETATTIHTKAGSPTSGDNTSVGYKLDVLTTQKTGSYSGTVTYTATGVLE